MHEAGYFFGIMNDWLSPPGDTILDLIEERNWTQSQLAKHMGYTTEYINQLINGKALINEEIAVKLEQVLGSTAGFWLNREFQYRNQLTKMKKLNLYHVSADFLGENLEYGGYFDIVTYTSEKAKEMLVEWLKKWCNSNEDYKYYLDELEEQLKLDNTLLHGSFTDETEEGIWLEEYQCLSWQ